MIIPETLIDLIKPDWEAPANVSACCTTRGGGVSEGPFHQFNLATHVGDDESAVFSNRESLVRQVGLVHQPCWLKQTHSIRVETLIDVVNYNADVDAAITRNLNTVAVVMTADCLPILLCNRNGTEVAAIHAGWRGLADGVVQSTLTAMDSPADDLLAWIGPAISQKRFEVGDEVYRIFADRQENASRHFVANRPGHWLCDLPGLATELLKQSGLTAVKQSGLCSFEDEKRFYSYRRNQVTGRMASLIWINSPA